MKINNAINSFFETKEQYVAFISAWKSFIAEGKHKKYPLTSCGQEYDKVSDLECVHHLIYAALRGKDISKNFTPNNRTQSYYGKFEAFNSAKESVYYASKNDRSFNNIKNVFGDTVTQDMLVRLYEELKSIKLS